MWIGCSDCEQRDDSKDSSECKAHAKLYDIV